MLLRSQMMADTTELIHRQRALAQFGDFVLDHDDLQTILTEACRLIAEAMDVDLAKVMEIDRATNTAVMRAGVGWRPGLVGVERITLDPGTSEGFAIEAGKPVITNDIAQETRFRFPDFLLEHGVVALVNVPIFLPGRKPYGVLQVDARRPREFKQDDIEFLKTYAMVLGPVVDRLETKAALAATHERFRLVVENAHDYVMILSDVDDHITDWLAGSETILGWSMDEVMGKPTTIIFTREDRDAGIPERELRVAREKGASPNVRWHLRKDNSRVFLDGQTIALEGPEGELRGYLKIGQDVTERKRAEERQAVLLAELQHRVRNVLAVVSSVVKRTALRGESADQMREQLQGRLQALARTQALLTRAVGQGVDLHKLVTEALEAQAVDTHKFDLSGPSVELAPKMAEVMTLAVHELTTNAVKYGVLAEESGRLSVRWERYDRNGEPWLRLVWAETGAQIDLSVSRRTGFGTELITQRIPYELDGIADMDYTADGLRCTIESPLRHGNSTLETGSPD